MKNTHSRRVGAAALALVFSLIIAAPVIASGRDQTKDPKDRITRIVKKIKSVIGIVATADGPTPPKP